MSGSDIEIVPWFGGAPLVVQNLDDTESVAYSWSRRAEADREQAPTIHDLLIWHVCDQRIGQVDNRDRPGWTPWGAGLHTLHSVYPLHIEASVYYPECCGMHGFIRDGRWVSV